MYKRVVKGTRIEVSQDEYEALKKGNLCGQVPFEVPVEDWNRVRRKLGKSTM